ncbi:piriformospora indica-insensitive protein 2-like [Camellia sinensis]|uniref:Leucine-rich repeat-containing N-terminal plant-type domain-containing protein n=1 Tax=Camellia sinensis var. sinensis TaxID=542762 RepID=A0A4S4F3R3_CAMSN|nr:piriformospora indica-insensitive protein 2-like [Camellia sinensis]THG23506.1 hypothetical protein TEA_026355 [Camellia sinensis var. sinensis]
MKNFNTQIHIRVFLLVVFVVIGPYILCSSQEEEDIFTAPMEVKERKALYYAIQGFVGKWWNGSDLYPDPCGWTPIQGVSCDLFNGSWYVTAINIGPVFDNSLQCAPNAEFNHHLFKLNHLKSLSFYNCFIRKPVEIPTSNWQKLANSLETLEFRSNPSLIGAIPSTLGYLKSLQSLVLLENGLTGQLPTDIGNLVNLKRLVLAGNRFVGHIPANWGLSLTKLLILDSSRNYLSGSMPLTFGGLTSLLKLDLSNNLLEGVLPRQITLNNLILLDLSHNKFSGGLTHSLHEMVSLEEMVLSNNPIMGGDLTSIQWETLQNLEFLDLSNMGLTGNIPETLTGLKRLRFLGLTNNSLSGNVSPRFEDMPCLGALYFRGNNLTGKLEFSEFFYKKMGNRFGASNNPNLCYSSVELMDSRYVPFGVKLCQQERSVLDRDSMVKISDSNLHQDSPFVGSLGFSSCAGNRFFWANEIIMFVVWIIMLL